jgi:hypothetical protein
VPFIKQPEGKPEAEPDPEMVESEDEVVVAYNRDRFELMGFDAMDALMLAHAGAHPTEIQNALDDGCPRHLVTEIWL